MISNDFVHEPLHLYTLIYQYRLVYITLSSDMGNCDWPELAVYNRLINIYHYVRCGGVRV